MRLNDIEILNRKLKSAFWDYSAAYINVNGYSKHKSIDDRTLKELIKLEKVIKELKLKHGV